MTLKEAKEEYFTFVQTSLRDFLGVPRVAGPVLTNPVRPASVDETLILPLPE